MEHYLFPQMRLLFEKYLKIRPLLPCRGTRWILFRGGAQNMGRLVTYTLCATWIQRQQPRKFCVVRDHLDGNGGGEAPKNLPVPYRHGSFCGYVYSEENSGSGIGLIPFYH